MSDTYKCDLCGKKVTGAVYDAIAEKTYCAKCFETKYEVPKKGIKFTLKKK